MDAMEPRFQSLTSQAAADLTWGTKVGSPHARATQLRPRGMAFQSWCPQVLSLLRVPSHSFQGVFLLENLQKKAVGTEWGISPQSHPSHLFSRNPPIRTEACQERMGMNGERARRYTASVCEQRLAHRSHAFGYKLDRTLHVLLSAMLRINVLSSLAIGIADECEVLLLQTQTGLQRRKPWDDHVYWVGVHHKAGSHLLRNVMRHAFDGLGAGYSCHTHCPHRCRVPS